MTNPQIKPEARVQIYEGMSVETVKKEGSTGQKIAVPLFDNDGNGKLEGYEVTRMNRCNFKSESGKLTIFENREDGKRREMEIKYGSLEELYTFAPSGRALNDMNHFFFGCYEKNGQKYHKHSFSKVADYEKISIDMSNAKVTVQGAEGNLYARDIELSVKDSDLEKISIKGGKLKLENVKDEGLLWDSATEVKSDGKTVVSADANSKYEVSKEE